MTTTALDPIALRRCRQLRIGALLDEIEARRSRIRVLAAAGVRAAGLRDLKQELGAVKRELAELVGR